MNRRGFLGSAIAGCMAVFMPSLKAKPPQEVFNFGSSRSLAEKVITSPLPEELTILPTVLERWKKYQEEQQEAIMKLKTAIRSRG